METDSGQPGGQFGGGDLPPGDDHELPGRPSAGQEAADQRAAGHEAAGRESPDDVTGGAEMTGVAQAGPPEAQAGPPEAQVDEAIAGLDGLQGRPLAEHVAVFEEAHAKLRQVLSDLDDGPADS